ncbi:unnamed protein product, partial [Closterium sp. NIES-64]
LALIRSLPIFKTTLGNFTAIDPDLHCVAPPVAFYQPKDATCLQDRDSPGEKALLSCLGVRVIDEADVLAKFALPGFDGQGEEERERVLQYVVQHWQQLKQKPAVVDALKETKFVIPAPPAADAASLFPPPDSFPAIALSVAAATSAPLTTSSSPHPSHPLDSFPSASISSARVRPCDLLDPANNLLRQVFVHCPERFPGGQFETSRWLPVLRDCGLQSAFTPDLFLQCASAVEARYVSFLESSSAAAAAAAANTAGGAAGVAAAGGNSASDSFLLFGGEDPSQESDTGDFENVDLFSGGRTTGGSSSSGGLSIAAGAATGGGGVVGGGPVVGVEEELWVVAGRLTEALLANVAVVFGSSAMESLGQIRFIPAERGIPTGGAAVDRRCLASYAACVAPSDWPLAWTAVPVLVREAFVPPQFTWLKLSLKSPPPLSLVLTHLKVLGRGGGEETLARWPNIVGGKSVEEAFEQIFKFLASHWSSLDPPDIRSLKPVSLVPVANGTRLVPASALFARLGPDLAPYLFELPRRFLPFSQLLVDLGMHDSPSPSALSSFLSALHRSSGGQRLNPNELRAVLRILRLVCEGEEENGGGGGRGGAAGTLPCRSAALSPLLAHAVVPDDSCRLVPAHSCVVVDPAAVFLANEIDPRCLRLVHPLLPPSHAARLGIPSLSQVVEQELDPNLLMQQVGSVGGVSLRNVAERISSREFAAAAWSILHQFAAAAAASTPSSLFSSDVTPPSSRAPPSFSPIQSRDDVWRALTRAAQGLRFVSGLHTRFVILPLQPGLRRALALGSPAALVSATSGSSRSGSEAEGEEEGRLGAELATSGSEGQARMPSLWQQRVAAERGGMPGEVVAAADVALLQCHPLRPFHAGEVVAWREERGGGGGGLLAGKWFGQGQGAGGGGGSSRAAGSTLDPASSSPAAPASTLRYGRVVADVRATAGQALCRVQVETFPNEMRLLLSSSILSFKSSTSSSASAAAAAATAGAAGEDAAPPAAAAASPGSLALPPTSLGEAASSAATSPPAGAMSAPSVVPPGEVVRAVNDMLAAAGIPLGGGQQRLLTQLLTMQEQVAAVEATLAHEQARAEQAEKEAESAKAAWTCRICLAADVSAVLVPCGHVLCASCIASVHRCPFCRSHVVQTVRLFRP